jgi:hypothetical protein
MERSFSFTRSSHMRPIWRYTATFVVGLVLGAVVTATVVRSQSKRNVRNWFVIQLADQADVAQEILSGRGPALEEHIKSRLPEYVSTVRGPLGAGDEANWALWVVRDVYEAAGTPAPPELQPIFAALPPRASCKRPSAGGIESPDLEDALFQIDGDASTLGHGLHFSREHCS